MARVLVIAAHPDDEILGCGGAMARHVADGDSVSTIILAEGLTSRQDTRDREAAAEELNTLRGAAEAANAAVGVTDLRLLDFPDNRMDGLERLDVVKAVEAEIRRVEPDVVYTHHAGDVNVDHRRIHDAVVTAVRPLPGQVVRTLLFFEVASSTEWQPPGSAPGFAPNWFVAVSEQQFRRKIEALKAYAGEMRPWPHTRSVEALTHLGRWRGATIGTDYAEAFVLGRHIAKETRP